jgi:PPIC-type peptidyl-prolyl cis-trans isomerase-like protein
MTKAWTRTLVAILAAAALTAGCGGEEENPNLANVQLEQLLVKPIPQQEAMDKACSQAREVLEMIQGGADFAEMAAQYSTHLSAADSGLITVTQGWMPEGFDEAALAIKDSTLSDVIHTPQACFLVYRIKGTYLQVRSSHILVGVDREKKGEALEADFRKTEKKAWDLYRQLMDGASFYEMAREHSDDPGSAQNGGDISWVKRGQLVKEYELAAYGQEPGEISEPVRSLFGWHIIRTVQKKDLSLTVRLIEFAAPVTESDRRRARRALEQVRRRAEEGTSIAALAQELEGNPEGTFSHGEKFSVRKNVVRPELASQLSEMEAGDVSGVLENNKGFYFVRLLEDE